MAIRPPQRILTEILLQKDRLTLAIRNAIDHTFRAAQNGCVGHAGEVDRLVYFFLQGLPLIESQFNRILQNTGVSATLSGIFCHQTPRVIPIPASPTQPPRCELGDILFLVTYGKKLYGQYLGNAMLVQAKEDASTVDGTTQAHLYGQATDFEYASPRQLASKQRDLRNTEFALWYWGFQSHYWHPRFPWETEGIAARPNSRGGYGKPFEVALMDLICGVNGRRAKALEAASSEIGWSKIVDDLIRVTANAAFTRQNAYISRNKLPLRGEEICRVLKSMPQNSSSPFLIRCSLDRIFRFFDQELSETGRMLTNKSEEFDRERFLDSYREKVANFDGGEKPPILGNERPDMLEEEGGCSFVIINLE